jgi:hypothetical protein
VKLITLGFTVAIATIAVSAISTNVLASDNSLQAQSNTTIIRRNNVDLNRAKNLARQAAVQANGGLGQYRPEDAMHGPAAQSPHVDNGDGTWTFTIRGRRPNSQVFTMETVVTVSRDGKQVTVDYNGPIRDR